MQSQGNITILTSGQLDPKIKSENKQNTAMPFIIDGCAVFCTSTARGTEEPIKAVKEILMSAYRTRTARR